MYKKSSKFRVLKLSCGGCSRWFVVTKNETPSGQGFTTRQAAFNELARRQWQQPIPTNDVQQECKRCGGYHPTTECEEPRAHKERA